MLMVGKSFRDGTDEMGYLAFAYEWIKKNDAWAHVLNIR
jgi:hypothetical protein